MAEQSPEQHPEPDRTTATNGEANEAAGCWLTYATAGERFGLSADAVRMRAKRLGWRTQPGNDGRTLVWIDQTAPEPTAEQKEQRPEQPEQTGTGLLQRAVVAFESSVTLLGEQLAAERERAKAEQERANGLAERFGVAIAELAATRAALDQAQAETTAARQAAEVRIASLEADAERARGVAQEAVQAAETLQATVDELKAEQAQMVDSHARDLSVAEHDARAAQQAAAELRQAEEDRKARGRLRRAWDGWRGR